MCGLQEDYCDCNFDMQCGLECCLRRRPSDGDIALPDEDSFYISSDSTSEEEQVLLEFEPQSGVPEMNISSQPQQTTHQNVIFQDQIPQFHVDIDHDQDNTRKIADEDNMPLAEFMTRPQLIFQTDWSGSTLVDYSFNPWELIYTHPTITNRISNFKLLKSRLKIKVVINGNGFFYGRLAMFYRPLHGFDGFSQTRNAIPQDFIQNSQCPAIYIDPTLSLGGEMTLPFFWHENYFDIASGDINQAGRIFLQVLNPLKHANDESPAPLTVTVFAWAEDFDMFVPTSLDANAISPQSGEEIDEANECGVVSGPATKISTIAGMMGSIPMIGRFASATSIAAGAVASMAKMFGYSRPPVTKNPEPYRAHVVSSLALTNVPDTAYKLTVDDKQELSIDPRIAGIGGEDPYNILRIAQKESYLTTFTWALSDTPGTLLYNSVVAPGLWGESTLLGGTAIHLPACAYAALPFSYWTGTIRFRFQVVASAYHKGRMKVAYDPNFFDNPNAYNQNHLRVVDIADEQDFVIEVGMAQQRNWVASLKPHSDALSNQINTSSFLTPSGFNSNGVIALQVLTELTAPNYVINNDVQVNVYISVGDDFELASPSEEFAKYEFRRFTPQSGFEPQSGGVHVPDSLGSASMNRPEQPQMYRLGPKLIDKANQFEVFFGERVQSFRTLLKRYNLHSSVVTTPLPEVNTFFRTSYPFHKGYIPTTASAAYTQTAAGDRYNYCNMTMLHWISMPFIGWRGSVRYKVVPYERNTRSDYITVERGQLEDNRAPHDDQVSSGRTQPTTAKEAGLDIILEDQPSATTTVRPAHGALGVGLALGSINPALEFEVPFYSSRRFIPGRSPTQTESLTPAYEPQYGVRAATTQSSTLHFYVAGGEDFQSYFWVGMPPIFYTGTTPPA
jgi:hypothetical protein